MAQSKSIRLMLTVVLFTVIVLATSTPVIAVVNAGQEVVLDFTQPDKIKQFARWTAECRIDSTRDGLGWDGPANAGCDVVIETVKPIAERASTIVDSWEATSATQGPKTLY